MGSPGADSITKRTYKQFSAPVCPDKNDHGTYHCCDLDDAIVMVERGSFRHFTGLCEDFARLHVLLGDSSGTAVGHAAQPAYPIGVEADPLLLRSMSEGGQVQRDHRGLSEVEGHRGLLRSAMESQAQEQGERHRRWR